MLGGQLVLVTMQQGLQLIFRKTIRTGDTILVSTPLYFTYTCFFDTELRPHTHSVSSTKQKQMNVQRLTKLLRRSYCRYPLVQSNHPSPQSKQLQAWTWKLHERHRTFSYICECWDLHLVGPGKNYHIQEQKEDQFSSCFRLAVVVTVPTELVSCISGNLGYNHQIKFWSIYPWSTSQLLNVQIVG